MSLATPTTPRTLGDATGVANHDGGRSRRWWTAANSVVAVAAVALSVVALTDDRAAPPAAPSAPAAVVVTSPFSPIAPARPGVVDRAQQPLGTAALCSGRRVVPMEPC